MGGADSYVQKKTVRSAKALSSTSYVLNNVEGIAGVRGCLRVMSTMSTGIHLM